MLYVTLEGYLISKREKNVCERSVIQTHKVAFVVFHYGHKLGSKGEIKFIHCHTVDYQNTVLRVFSALLEPAEHPVFSG
jgi:hypothetical protein